MTMVMKALIEKANNLPKYDEIHPVFVCVVVFFKTLLYNVIHFLQRFDLDKSVIRRMIAYIS